MPDIDIKLQMLEEYGTLLGTYQVQVVPGKTYAKFVEVRTRLDQNLRGYVYLEHPISLEGVSPSANVPVHIRCGELFLREPLLQSATITGMITISTVTSRRDLDPGRQWDRVLECSIEIRMTSPKQTFALARALRSIEFHDPNHREKIILRNEANQLLFFKAAVSPNLQQFVRISYPIQLERFKASRLIPPGGEIPIELAVTANAPAGNYSGELRITDAFGKELHIPLNIVIDLPVRQGGFLRRMIRKRRLSPQEQIEDALIRYAAKNDGILTRDQVLQTLARYPGKDLLLVLQRLEEQGLVEQAHGVYIFKQLID